MPKSIQDNCLMKSLRLKVLIGVERESIIDFNRLRYIGAPKNSDIRIGKVEFANRDEQVITWYRKFSNANQFTDITLNGYFCNLTFYVALIDNASLELDSREAVELFEATLIEHVRLGKHSVGWARKVHSGLKTLFRLLNWSSIEHFSVYPIFRNESLPTPAYSDTEIKRILKLLMRLFNQLHKSLLEDIEYHLNANNRQKTVELNYLQYSVKVSGAITKYFCLSYFLMSYYTWANMFCLLKLKRPQKMQTDSGIWYSQIVEKKRARKFVNIELGGNGSAIIPKYGLSVLEKITKVSILVSPNKNRLFHAMLRGKIIALESNHLTAFTNWLIKNFDLKGDNGWPLRLQSQRFRVTGSSRFLSYTNDPIAASTLLGNTPNVVSKHYSSGNEHENNTQLQAVSRVLENSAKCNSVEEAIRKTKKDLNIEVLPYDEFIRKFTGIANPEKTIIGTGCKDPFSARVTKYNRQNTELVSDEKTIACADIAYCFQCENQVIVEEVDDIWCLLSFKEALEDSRHDHESLSHFKRNYGETITRIEHACFRVSPKIRRKAEKKLRLEGRHPLWSNELNLDF